MPRSLEQAVAKAKLAATELRFREKVRDARQKRDVLLSRSAAPSPPRAVRRITALKLAELSLVDRPAVPMPGMAGNVLMRKSHNGEFSTTFVVIRKGAPEQRFVLCAALIPETVDAQGDVIGEDVIRDAAHAFIDKRQVGLQHKSLLDSDAARVVESYIAPNDLTIEGQTVKAGTWLVGLKLGSDLWASVKSGALLGVSIGGAAETVPVT